MGEYIPTILDDGYLKNCAHCERKRQSENISTLPVNGRVYPICSG
jgi:hypothetical protein